MFLILQIHHQTEKSKNIHVYICTPGVAKYMWAMSWENLSSGFATRKDTATVTS